jgi:polyhydroxyalkanoate synthesis regulator phasin
MSPPTLEEFIKTYVENKAKRESPESYADWLMKNGVNAEKILSDRTSIINSDYAKALSGYGKNAEALSGLGLTASGYSDYLKGKAYSVMQSQKQKAISDYTESLRKNASEYSDYMTKITSETNEKIRKTVNDIVKKGFINYEDAYNYAVTVGLSEDDAKAAAKGGSDSARTELKREVMKAIKNSALNKNEAYNYALGVGLTKEEAAILASYADNMNKYFDLSDEEIDRIIDEINGNKKK